MADTSKFWALKEHFVQNKTKNANASTCIVDKENRILSIGYNGTPNGFSDDNFPWDKTSSNPNETKYPYVCHAELNAILNYTGTSLKGSKLYVNLFPCNECAKAIIQSGIKEIIYKEDKYANSEATKVSKKMLELSNVVYRQYETKDKKVILSL